MVLRLSLPRCLAASLVMVCPLHRRADSAPQTLPPLVTIYPREIVDLGTPTAEVNEPDVAVSRVHRVAAAQILNAGGGDTRRAVATNQAGGWTSGELSGFQASDVCVALVDGTPNANKFVVFGMANPFNGTIRYCVYAPDSTPQFGPWTIAYDSAGQPGGNDKPWVVRRTSSDFFLFFFLGGPNGCRYLRTSDGTNWGAPGNVLPSYAVADASAVTIPGTFCCQPAVGADGKVWLAYATDIFGSGGEIRILVGTDPENDNTGPLVFAPLLQANGSPVAISPRHSQTLAWPATSPGGSIIGKPVPYLACDPADDSVAYVFYTDTAPSDSDDLNAYVARFTKDGGAWSAETRVIHDEHTSPLGVPCDQFQPVGFVDSLGRLHAVYYSNRPDGLGECDVDGYGSQYDVWYSLSVDGGLTFTPHNLRTDCDMKRPLDLDLQIAADGTTSAFSPREYNGIDCYESGDTARIHVVYTGAVNDPGIPDDFDQRSLLFGQQIHVKTVQAP